MQRILDLIEATLEAEVTPAELAEQSGYSLWHFLHLFQREVGLPLCRYRTKRRLVHALYAVSRGMHMTDAALRWGFGSHSGFYRACRREYGMSPTAYLRSHRVNAPAVPLLKEEVFRMLNRDKFREALVCWGEGYAALPLHPVTYPASGHVSDSAMYVGDDLMLKAYRDVQAARLAIAMAELLHQKKMPAAVAIPLQDGEKLLPLQDGLWMTLCRRIPGKPMSSRELICHPQQGERIGAAIAALHKAAEALDTTLYADDEPYADQLLGWALPRAQEALPDAFPQDYAARVEALRTLPTALVHRDPNPSNLIDAGEAVGFIDFDLSRRCVRIFDPCYAMTAVLSEVFEQDGLPWQENWPAFCRSVLAGYGSVSPLSEAEKAAVPTMILGNELLCLAAFIGSSKYRSIYETNRRMLPYLLENMPV